MFRLMNQYLASIHLSPAGKHHDRIDAFLKKQKSIRKYLIQTAGDTEMIHIYLNHFSVQAADRLFRRFASAVCFPYSQMSLRYNEGSHICYRLATCQENKEGFYMNVVFE